MTPHKFSSYERVGIAQIPINPLYTSDSKICNLANSEDPDEMLQNAAFHLGLHCLLKKENTHLNRKKYIFFF